MTISRIFLYLCISFIVGIFLGPILVFLIKNKEIIMLLGFALGILLILYVFWFFNREKRNKIIVIGFCILFLILGIWRYDLIEQRINNNELNQINDLEDIIVLTGIVSKEVDVRDNHLKIIIESEKIFNLNFKTQIFDVRGKVLLITHRYPEFEYGDRLRITGQLSAPENIQDFNYKNYLLKDGIYSTMFYPEIELIEKNQGNILLAGIFKFKDKLRQTIYENLPPTQGSILGAMILGDKRNLSQELKQKLNITGVRHITAISGLHITILTAILVSFLLWLGFWRQQSFYITVIIITLFVVLTGFQPSAIRASLMGSIFLLAQYLGRMSVSSRIVIFVATMMLAINPLLLRLDIGFQLSFLAVIGIIYLSPIFNNYLNFISWENPRSILSMTFSAYIFTLPILITNFGYISLIGPLTNVLIMPFLYLIMIFGLFFILLGSLVPIVAWVLSFPVILPLLYVTKVVDYFSSISLAYKAIENVNQIHFIIYYIFLGFLIFKTRKRFNLIISRI